MTAGEGNPADRPGSRGPAPRRGFRVLDGMILVAATAVGFALTEGIARASNGSHSWALVRAAWSDLRQLISQGRDPRYIVPEEVRRIIRETRCYAAVQR